MKLRCPKCSAIVPAGDIDLENGVGKCSNCNDVFPLSSVLGAQLPNGQIDQRRIRKPENARTILTRHSKNLEIEIPELGMQAPNWLLLFAAIMWLSFVALWTAAVLGFFPIIPQNEEAFTSALMSIPFWLIGIGALAFNFFTAKSKRQMTITASDVTYRWQCLWWSRTKRCSIDVVQFAKVHLAPFRQTSGGLQIATYGAEITYDRGSTILMCDTQEEADWLVREINWFLKEIGSR